MEFLQGFKVGKRLAAGFSLLLLLIVAVVAIALYGLYGSRQSIERIVNINGEKTRLLNEMMEANAGTFVARRDMLLATTPENLDAGKAALARFREAYVKAADTLFAMPTDARGQANRDLIEKTFKDSIELTKHVTELIDAGDVAGATTFLHEKAAPSTQRWQDAIKRNVAYQYENNAKGNTQLQALIGRSTWLLVALGAAAILLGIFAAIAITRSLTRPLERATTAARDIANGKLDGSRLEGGRDEVGDLLRSMQAMRDTLLRFAGESKRMATLHATGEDIGYHMPEDFPGTYNELVTGTNKMVYEHLDAIMVAIDVLNRYAIGDLAPDVPRLPGQRAVLHESMDTAKANLSAMRDSVLRLSEAAGRGDFGIREDAGKFQHSFHDMVAALNRLMEQAGDSLGDVGRVMSAIAEGDLQQRVEKQYEGSFGQLAQDANTTVDQLTRIVTGIQHASGAINTAASEIASGNHDLSRRTEQQAANLEETAASMEELTSTVRQNAESARQANQLAQNATTVAQEGGDVVGRVVTTMQGIETSSRKIGEIISVIDGIAFQTNILALNAAVEAARAGEQGRGFAVVASEVRALAQRSAEAAKEIKGLIEESVGKVADGSALVNKAGQTMSEIVTSVQRVTDIMTEISAASQEQSAGIEQINQAVTQMDETTQQNAALVEEATAAARSMEDQANSLSSAVAVFKLLAGARNAAPKSPALPARPVAPAKSAPVTLVASSTGKSTAPAAAKPPRRPVELEVIAGSDGEWKEF